nr:GNAT family protein [Allorhizobium sonneratiae]
MRPATVDDIAFMMAEERQPGYEHLVGRFSEEEHRANLNDPTTAYKLAVGDDGQALGFVFFRDLNSPYQSVYIKRVVVAEPQRGVGTAMMRLAISWAFSQGGAHRLWLTHLPDNLRARALYEKLGFQQEGVWRQAYVRPDGSRCDLLQMSLLKPEWERMDISTSRV